MLVILISIFEFGRHYFVQSSAFSLPPQAVFSLSHLAIPDPVWLDDPQLAFRRPALEYRNDAPQKRNQRQLTMIPECVPGGCA
jgi:hypothetical protein